MTKSSDEQSKFGQFFRELPIWYYIFIVILTILSLFTITGNNNGEWTITIGVREVTPILLALGILPLVFGFIRSFQKGELKLFGGSIAWESKLDEEVSKTADKHFNAEESIKNLQKDPSQLEEIRRNADNELTNAIPIEVLALVEQFSLRELQGLVKEFNRNRNLPFSNGRTIQGDKIAARMRAIAPLLFSQFDVNSWLESVSPGKRLASIKYLDWSQDIEFLDDLMNRLDSEQPFMQFHTLIAIYNMVDQITVIQQQALREKLAAYAAEGDSSRAFWKGEILKSLKRFSKGEIE